jgi:NADPH:quinone reductase-like Zn-dependent oxidoreductase
MITTATTMRASVHREYGEAERVVSVETISRPVPGPSEVLVHVMGAGVDRGVWHIMAGLPYPIRLAGYGFRAPKKPVLGMALAGRVEAVGGDVSGFAYGDLVFGVGKGTFAEYAVADAAKLTRMPAGLLPDKAAAVPISGHTALQAVRDHGRVQPGQSVLILGASGGVGSFAVQIATAYGAEVTGVCSTAKVDFVRSLGADRVLDYTTTGITDDGRRYDVILDIGGNRPLRELRRALTPTGTLVFVGGETGGRWLGGLQRQLWAAAISPFLKQRMVMFVAGEQAPDLDELRDLIEAGKVTPAVDRIFGLDRAAEAIAYVRDGRAQGKVVLSI